MLNRAAFYNAVRPALFGGRLSKGQVNGLGAILDEWDRRVGAGQTRRLAYVLATVKHETADTMEPIPERGRRSYFDKYEPRTRLGRTLGNTLPGDGFRFRGRGFVQITGRANYHKIGRRLRVDLVGNPDLALRFDIAPAILIVGMVEGLFTGAKLADYISGAACDYRGARRIVNGLDKATLIAGYASRFEAALEAADVPLPPDVEPVIEPTAGPVPDPDLDMRRLPEPEDRSAIKRIGAVIAATVAGGVTWISENPVEVTGGIAAAAGLITLIVWRSRK